MEKCPLIAHVDQNIAPWTHVEHSLLQPTASFQERPIPRTAGQARRVALNGFSRGNVIPLKHAVFHS
jgi:hypothetical protein